MTVIAIDVGGTGIKSALVDAAGTILHAERHPTGASRGSDAVVATILGIAAGLAGTATARWAANVGFRDVPLRDLLGRHLGLPAVLGHDVRAGGMAEARWGAGRG